MTWVARETVGMCGTWLEPALLNSSTSCLDVESIDLSLEVGARIMRAQHRQPTALRLWQRQMAAPARLLCTGLTSRSEAVGRTQRSLYRRRSLSRHSLLHTRRDPHAANGGDDEVGHHDTGPWAVLACTPLSYSIATWPGSQRAQDAQVLEAQHLSHHIIDVFPQPGHKSQSVAQSVARAMGASHRTTGSAC